MYAYTVSFTVANSSLAAADQLDRELALSPSIIVLYDARLRSAITCVVCLLDPASHVVCKLRHARYVLYGADNIF